MLVRKRGFAAARRGSHRASVRTPSTRSPLDSSCAGASADCVQASFVILHSFFSFQPRPLSLRRELWRSQAALTPMSSQRLSTAHRTVPPVQLRLMGRYGLLHFYSVHDRVQADGLPQDVLLRRRRVRRERWSIYACARGNDGCWWRRWRNGGEHDRYVSVAVDFSGCSLKPVVSFLVA